MTVAAAASAAAPVVEQSSAPIIAEAAPPAPLSEAPPPGAEAKVEEPKAPISTRDALRAAAAKVEKEEAAKLTGAAIDPKEAAKDPAKGADLKRGDGGKFVPKDAAAAAAKDVIDPAAAKDPAAAAAAKPGEPPPAAAKRTVNAPDRFSNDAKAVWDTAPEPVKAEVDRMHRELTQGIEKHRVGAEKFETIKHFDEMATRSGTDLKTALTNYTSLEAVLRQNPLKGLERVCENIGVSLRDVAQIVLGQTPDQHQSQSDATIRELRAELNQVKQQVGGVTQHFQKQHETTLHDQITKWAESRPHFDIIAPHIAAEMREGATSLDEAETRVLQKYPALAAIAKANETPADPKPAASSAAASELLAQTEKGQKSVHGAPGSGSEPVTQVRSSSIKEALKRAAAKAG